MSARVLLRAQSTGPRGIESLARTRAVAEELLARGVEAPCIVDDEAAAVRLRRLGIEAWSVLERPGWSLEPARGAWIDGALSDWTPDLRRLARRGIPRYLVANRTAAREGASFVVQPKLFVDADPWERVHAARVLRGARWIPLSRSVRAARSSGPRDLDVLVALRADDPPDASVRVLAALPPGARVAVASGARSPGGEAALTRAGAHLNLTLVPDGEALEPWMARARCAVASIGVLLFELAFLRTPALVLASHPSEQPMLDFYRRRGLFHPLGVDGERTGPSLALALEQARASIEGPSPILPDLGDGAIRLAERLVGASTVSAAA